MKKYFFEMSLFIFIVIYKFFVLEYLANYADIILVIGWLGAFVFLYKKYGIRKDNSLLKSTVTKVVIITILIYILLSYLSGIFFGFLRNSYALDLISIVKNVYPILFMIFAQELIRFIVAKKSKGIKNLSILTVLYVVMEIVLTFNAVNVSTGVKLFVYITSVILPVLARNIICSYIVYNVSFVPSLILRLFFNLYIYIFPLFSDLGYYLESVIGLCIPYILYLIISNLVEKVDKVHSLNINNITWFINIPLGIMLMTLILLISGISKYQIMAIGSGSMEPYLYVGDTVIFEHISDEVFIDVDDVIVYEKDDVYVTHRVIGVSTINDVKTYKTKGDNNKFEDKYQVKEDEIVGIVRVRIKAIGLPTIWFNDLLS